MKLKKILTLMCCAVLLVCISVGATVAYLTSTDKVQNTFTVGKVAITLDETDVKLDGTKDTDARVDANEYKLMPGHTYIKDPTVHVAAESEPSYIRMIVTINDIKDLKAACGVAEADPFLPQNFVTGWDNTKWVTTNEIKTDGDTCTYEFRYYTTVSTVGAAAKDLEPLFTAITMPGTATNAQIEALEELQIDIVAHAIQADGFADAAAAWAAWNN